MYRVIYIMIIFFVVLQMKELRAEDISYEKSLYLKKNKNYAQAEQGFLSLVKQNEQNAEFWFQLGVVQRYQNKFQEALVSQTRAIELSPNNEDIKLELVRLYSWNLELDKAEELVKEVLLEHPDNKDAHSLEESIRRNKILKADPIHYKWNISTGYQQSYYSENSEPNWHKTFLQIGNWITPKNFVHIRAENKDEYNTDDEYYELGVAHIFNDSFNGQFNLGYMENSSFESEWKFQTKANARVIHNHPSIGDTWITGDIQYDRYKYDEEITLKPGIRYEITDNIQIHTQYIYSVDEESNYLHGWAAKIGWQTPISELRLFGGTSGTPSMVDGKELDSQEYFVGFAYQVTSQAGIHTSYAHEKREDSLKQDAISLALSVKF